MPELGSPGGTDPPAMDLEVLQTKPASILRIGQWSVSFTRRVRIALSLAGLAMLCAPGSYFLSEFNQARGIVNLEYSRVWLFGLCVVIFLAFWLVSGQLFKRQTYSLLLSLFVAVSAFAGIDRWAPKPLPPPSRYYPWLEYTSVSNEHGIQFVRLILAVEDYPNTPIQKSLASLSSLENLHVKVVAHLYIKPTGDRSEGMTCTVAEFRVPQWNNDNATSQPVVNLKIRPDATVLEITVSATNGMWNGTSVILNRGT
jgi:hypothetical protein